MTMTREEFRRELDALLEKAFVEHEPEEEKRPVRVGDEFTLGDDEGYILAPDDGSRGYHIMLMRGYAMPRCIYYNDFDKIEFTGYCSSSVRKFVMMAADALESEVCCDD